MPSAADSAGAQIAATLYSGALSNATIKSSVSFQPDFLARVARSLILNGESVWVIQKDRSLLRVTDFDVRGGPEESSYIYSVNIPSPSSTITKVVPREGIVHFKWATDEHQPWRGVSPLDMAKGMSSLASKSAQSLSDGFNCTQLMVIPFMVEADPRGGIDGDGDIGITDNFDSIKASARPGQTTTLEMTHQSRWVKDDRNKDFEQKRLGPVLEQNSVLAAFKAQAEVLAICGIPPALLSSEGQSREALRLWITTQLEPLAKRISAELTQGLETEVVLDCSPISKSDITGRSRAFSQLVKSGMDLDKAAGITGILAENA